MTIHVITSSCVIVPALLLFHKAAEMYPFAFLPLVELFSSNSLIYLHNKCEYQRKVFTARTEN